MRGPILIQSTNLSIAWAQAFLACMKAAEIAPLIVTVRDIGPTGTKETTDIRAALDEALVGQGKNTCRTTANTIFPLALWNPEAEADRLYRAFMRIWPVVRKHRQNRAGTYFQRLIDFGGGRKPDNRVNQLQYVIGTWRRGNHRKSALQAAVLDPPRDHVHNRQRGFPCLQQVAFVPLGRSRLGVTGFYARQYIFDRAYGNYLGLARLGRFMAHEMGLELTQITCIASVASLGDVRKSSLGPLAESIRQMVRDSSSGHDTDLQNTLD